MDSDVSAEGDFDNESPKNRSWVSSNSEGQPSSPESAGKNSPINSSEGEASPDIKRASSSDRESSPDAKDSEASDAKDSDISDVESDTKENVASDREPSPKEKVVDNSDQESNGTKDYNDESNKESSPDIDSKDSHGSDKESSPELREIASPPVDEQQPVTPDFKSLSPNVRSPSLDERSPSARSPSPDERSQSARSPSPNERSVSPASENDFPEDRDNESPEEKEDSHEERDRDSRERELNDSHDEQDDDAHDERKPLSPIWKSPSANDVQPLSPEWKSPTKERRELSPAWNSPPYYDERRSRSKNPYKIDKRFKNVNGNGVSYGGVNSSQYDRKNEFSQKYPKDREKSSENKKAIIDFADDLSDVSDIESNDSFGGADDVQQKEIKKEPVVEEPKSPEPIIDKQLDDAVSLHVEGEEQLDFEAEEGECSPKVERIKEKEKIKEKEQSDLEEGELTDDNDTKPEETERPVCRFFSRGHCTWGSNCRFIHPGVMDKGNYSMFETVRPIVTPGGPPPPSSTPMIYPVFPAHVPHLPPERAGVIPPGGPITRKDEPPAESAWERGLRQAKEMIRKSSKRKETEVDFEDKKMNLTLSQDEIDKENDYYSRHSGSPVKSPDGNDKWSDSYPNEHPPSASHGAGDAPPIGYFPPLHHGMSRPDYWAPPRIGGLPYEEYGVRGPHIPYGPDYFSAAAGRRYMHPNSYYPPRPGNASGPPGHHPEFYDRKQKHKPYPGSSREVIVQKNDKPYKDEKYRNRREESPRIERARDDDWADPWMRTKSPATGRRRRRKDTYSSGSSYSSSSESSRSSSRSSFSSKSRNSRSQSKVRSSGSHSQSHSSSRSASESQTRKKPPMQFKLSPSSRAQLPALKKSVFTVDRENITQKSISPTLLSERRAATERALHMNPPPPSPKIKTRPHSPPITSAVPPSVTSTSPQRNKGGLPDRLLAHSKAAVAAAMRSARSSDSRSSKSSSGSSSSDTSSDSSDSSASSSSTSKSGKTPPIRTQKRNVLDDHVGMAQNVKTKAMDALKLSGQKQQIKLTLKGTGGGASQSKRGGPAGDAPDSHKDRLLSSSKKRAAESSESGSDSDRASPAKKASKVNQKKGGAPSRREELLKQLKAVEDAIARKRSKNS